MSDADPISGLDFSGLHTAQARPSRTLAGRRAAEKKPMPAADRRALRFKGRTAQLNIRVRPELKEAIEAHATERGVAVADLADEVWATFLKTERGP